MLRIRTVLSLFVTGALLAAPAPLLAQEAPPPGETPPTPAQVVEHCVRHLAGITGHTLEVMASTTGRAVEIVAELDSSGAPAPAIKRAGVAGHNRVGKAAQSGALAIEAEVQRCLRLLRELGAPAQAAAPILEARRRALDAIREGAVRSNSAIANAVRAALGGGGESPAGASAARSDAV